MGRVLPELFSNRLCLVQWIFWTITKSFLFMRFIPNLLHWPRLQCLPHSPNLIPIRHLLLSLLSRELNPLQFRLHNWFIRKLILQTLLLLFLLVSLLHIIVFEKLMLLGDDFRMTLDEKILWASSIHIKRWLRACTGFTLSIWGARFINLTISLMIYWRLFPGFLVPRFLGHIILRSKTWIWTVLVFLCDIRLIYLT